MYCYNVFQNALKLSLSLVFSLSLYTLLPFDIDTHKHLKQMLYVHFLLLTFITNMYNYLFYYAYCKEDSVVFDYACY